MKLLTLHQVPKLVFGPEALAAARGELAARGIERPFVVTSAFGVAQAASLHPHAQVDTSIAGEPTVADFERIVAAVCACGADAVVGLGGGSALDVAKLVAAFCGNAQMLGECWGIGKLRSRELPLFCIPTTAGTGSEVSPNAILLDEVERSKKAVISPHLVPDAVFVDPALTVTVPAAVTAATGIDALTHCMEAYANNFAHPLVDTWALDGIRHIAPHLVRAVREPANLEARTHLALGSLYGGLCLGPVNTAAVHALSYPLGARHHIAHGHANALLLPHVLRFNLPAAAERYADVALALGAERQSTAEQTARAGLGRLWQLIDGTGLEMRLSALGIAESEIPLLAAEGLAVTRLMRNNPCAISQAEAEAIYRAAFCGERNI